MKLKEVLLNIAQIAVVKTVLRGVKNIFLEWGRGTGKTTILGYFIREMVTQMPKASFALVGSTYMQILTKILPSAKEGLAMFDLYEDIDYTVGKCGKKFGFDMPFQSPDKWNNIIHFSNGAIFQMVSLDNPNSGRGLNAYGEIGDEAALLDPEKLFVNVSTTNRARKEIFENCSLLNCSIYMSSTPLTKKGKWFTDMEEECKKDPKNYAFIKANAYQNAHNLSKDYFTKARKNAPSVFYYKTEILNIRPTEILQGFYPSLNPERHYYTPKIQEENEDEYISSIINKNGYTSLDDLDCDPDKPLIVSMDFGVFNSITVNQANPKVYRTLKSFWAQSPKILDDIIIEQFLPYYHYHRNKKIRFYYGHDGNNRQANSQLTYADQVVKILKENGWHVVKMSRGAAPGHAEKYLVLNTLLKEERKDLPKLRINEDNNPDLIVSLERAEAKDAGEIKKDKSSERNKSIKQQHATHLSDAWDIPIYDMYHQMVLSKGMIDDYMRISVS